MKTNFIQNVIYTQLTDMADRSLLIPGQKYSITDRENIILEATSSSSYFYNMPNIDFIAGENIASMDAVVVGVSGQWFLCDATAYSTTKGMLAISLDSHNITEEMAVIMPGNIIINNSWTWNPGAELYVSETAGGITETPPTATNSCTRKIGYALTATSIYFNPSNDIITHT